MMRVVALRCGLWLAACSCVGCGASSAFADLQRDAPAAAQAVREGCRVSRQIVIDRAAAGELAADEARAAFAAVSARCRGMLDAAAALEPSGAAEGEAAP